MMPMAAHYREIYGAKIFSMGKKTLLLLEQRILRL